MSTHRTTPFYQTLIEHTDSDRQAFTQLPAIQRGICGNITRQHYVAFLINAYHHVKHTVPLLMACGAALRPHQHWLQKPIAEYISEEMGHEEWILNDLECCQENRQGVMDSAPPFDVDVMISYAYDVIHRQNPIGFFGMVLVLEGASAALATDAASAIANALSLPPHAFSYLRSHGSLDQSHVAFFGQLMDRVTHPDDQHAIVHGAKRFYRLYGNVLSAALGE